MRRLSSSYSITHHSPNQSTTIQGPVELHTWYRIVSNFIFFKYGLLCFTVQSKIEVPSYRSLPAEACLGSGQIGHTQHTE